MFIFTYVSILWDHDLFKTVRIRHLLLDIILYKIRYCDVLILVDFMIVFHGVVCSLTYDAVRIILSLEQCVVRL